VVSGPVVSVLAVSGRVASAQAVLGRAAWALAVLAPVAPEQVAQELAASVPVVLRGERVVAVLAAEAEPAAARRHCRETSVPLAEATLNATPGSFAIGPTCARRP
jgi:hypothetical protein